MKNNELKQKLEQGFIHTNIIFEVAGTPKEFVDNAITKYLKKLEEIEEVIIIKKDIDPATQSEDKIWVSIGETELLVKGLEMLNWLCLNYMPASIEILGPESMTFKARELTNWLNDLLAKSHEIAHISQQVGQQNKMMLKNINTLLRNTILICIDKGLTNSKEIAKKIGVGIEQLNPLFEAMQKEKTIKKNGENYTR